MVLKIVAVTACVSGVAHTYMAAERLQKVVFGPPFFFYAAKMRESCYEKM